MAKSLNENDLQAASGGVHCRVNEDESVSIMSDWGQGHFGTLAKEDASEENIKQVCKWAGDETGANRYYGADNATKLKATTAARAVKEWKDIKK